MGVFGIYFTTLNTFEMIYMFANRLKKTASIYKDDIAIQTSIKHYKDFIKNIKRNLDKKVE